MRPVGKSSPDSRSGPRPGTRASFYSPWPGISPPLRPQPTPAPLGSCQGDRGRFPTSFVLRAFHHPGRALSLSSVFSSIRWARGARGGYRAGRAWPTPLPSAPSFLTVLPSAPQLTFRAEGPRCGGVQGPDLTRQARAPRGVPWGKQAPTPGRGGGAGVGPAAGGA